MTHCGLYVELCTVLAWAVLSENKKRFISTKCAKCISEPPKTAETPLHSALSKFMNGERAPYMSKVHGIFHDHPFALIAKQFCHHQALQTTGKLRLHTKRKILNQHQFVLANNLAIRDTIDIAQIPIESLIMTWTVNNMWDWSTSTAKFLLLSLRTYNAMQPWAQVSGRGQCQRHRPRKNNSFDLKTHRRRPLRPPFRLVLSVGIGVTSSAKQKTTTVTPLWNTNL